MATTLALRRHFAFQAQSGRCFYCGLPMWESSPEEFVRAFGINPVQARRLQCTAEHLQARCDGGSDSSSNIVAACLHCNQTRHRMRPAPDHETFRTLVRRQRLNGAWHRKSVVDRLVQLIGQNCH